MTIATVVTRGYGSFGSIAFISARGYSLGEAVEAEVRRGGGWAPPHYVKGKAYKRRKDVIREELEALTREAVVLPPETQALVREQLEDVEARYDAVQELQEATVRIRRTNLLLAEVAALRRAIRRQREEAMILEAVMTYWYH